VQKRSEQEKARRAEMDREAEDHAVHEREEGEIEREEGEIEGGEGDPDFVDLDESDDGDFGSEGETEDM